MRAYFLASQVRRATSLVPLATLPGLLTLASLISCKLSSPSHLARASCNLGGSGSLSHLARASCNLGGSGSLSHLARASCNLGGSGSLSHLARASCNLGGSGSLSHLARASCNLGGSGSLSHLARASCNLGGSGSLSHLARASCNLGGSGSLSHLARASCNLGGSGSLSHLARASCNLGGSGSLSHLARASCNLGGSGSLSHLARASCNLGGSGSLSHLARASCNLGGSGSLSHLARASCNLGGSGSLSHLARASCNLGGSGSLSHLARASCNLGGSGNPCEFTFLHRSHLARASCNLAESANSCELTFLHRKFAEPPRSCLLQPWVLSPGRVYFSASQVRGDTSLSSCNFVGSVNPCELTFLHGKFADPPRLCFLQPCRVRRATSLVPLATLPGVPTRARLLSGTASSPSHLARTSCNLARCANPCKNTFLDRKSAEPPRSCLLQPCSQVRLAISLVPLSILPGLLSRASLLSCIAGSLSHLARASCNLAGYANLFELAFLHLKFADPLRSCHLQLCRVRRATLLVPLASFPGVLTRASLHSCTASLPSHLARASCNLAGSANPCEFNFFHRMFAEPPRSCLLQPCRVRRATSLVPLATLPDLQTPCALTFLHRKFAETPPACLQQPCRLCLSVRVYFLALQFRLVISLVPLAILPGLQTRASLLSSIASSLSHLARASCNLAGYANPCELTFRHRSPSHLARASCKLARCANPCKLTFLHRKFAKPPRSCLLQPCRGLLARGSLLSCTASSPSHLARASCNVAGSANPCEFTFQHRKFAEPPRSCLLQRCRVHRATSLVPLESFPGVLTRASLLSCTASSPSHLALASFNLAGFANPCEFNFLHRMFAEPPSSCLLEHCWVRRATSLVPLATLPGLLTRASLISCTAGSTSHLPRASCNLAGSANPCALTFLHCKFAEPPPSCLLQPCRLCLSVRVYFLALQVRLAISLVPLAIWPGLQTRASLLSSIASSLSDLARAPCNLAGLLSRTASSPCHLARDSCNLAGSSNPGEFTFLQRKFAEPPPSCLLQPCRICKPGRAYFPPPQVRRSTSLWPLSTLLGLLTRVSFISSTACSPSHLARASCNIPGSANPCELTFPHRKFAVPPRSCLLQPCRICKPGRAYFPPPQVRRSTSLWPLSTLLGLLTRVSFISSTACSPSHLARASCNLAGSANPGALTFPHRKFADPPHSGLFQPCWVRRATLLVPLATMLGGLTRASLLSCSASSPSHLPHASCNLAGSTNPCELAFQHRKFSEPPPSCLLQPRRVCLSVRVYFPALQVRLAISPVPLAIVLGLQTRASLLSCIAGSLSHLARASCNLAGLPSLLARASCDLAGSDHPCEFTFLHRKFAEPPPSSLLQPCRICKLVRPYFSAPQVCRACSLVPLATLPGLITRASLLSCTASSLSHLPQASCNLAGSANSCALTFLHRKFAEPARSCLLRPCRPLATLPDLQTRAPLLFCTASLPSLLARASCDLAGSDHPCEFTFLHRKFAEPPPSSLLQPCRICKLVRPYFSAPQVCRACSLVPLATLPGLITRASLLSCTASSLSHLPQASCNLAGSANSCALTFLHRKFAEPARSCLLRPCRPLATLPDLQTRAPLLFCTASLPSLLARASCDLAGSDHPCEFTFLHRKFAEPPPSSLLQPCRICKLVRPYFSAPQVCRACSLVPLATLPGLITRASLLSCTASSLSHLPQASCNLAGSANSCALTFLHRKFAEPARSCLLRPCRPLATLPDLQTRAPLLFCTASLPSLLARASCDLAGSDHPCEFTFLHRKFAEPPPSSLLQPCRICKLVRPYFSAPQVCRACSLVPLATLPGLITRASLLSCTASSLSHLPQASCNLAGSANSCALTFLHRKFAEPARSCLLRPCRPLATLPDLQTRAPLLFCTASLPSLLARASCDLAGSDHPCEFTFLHRKFAEPPPSSLLQPCRICKLVRPYFSAPQVCRACSLVPLATLPGLITRASLLSCTASSLSHLPQASCNLAGSANSCALTFLHRKFAEPARSCLLRPCRPLATLPDLQTRAPLLFCTASLPSLLARASCDLAGSDHPCEFTFLHRKFAEPTRSCLLQPCRICKLVRPYFSAPQVCRACSLVPLATLPGLITRASLLFCIASSPSHLPHASCNLAGSANPCEFTFLHRKFAEPPPSCLLQPCRVRRATLLVPLATMLGVLTRASLLSCTASSPSQLARASCNLAESANPCELTFLHRKFAEPPRSCHLQPCRVC
ncbi:hypothetical protein CRG98_046162 [Punica granatum]|uniref:Uncharacterized protein n=1 Tax=Punica granatum TaxID=22663 RepID=A0A2I0HNY8_PUNGR|nr:hypothetical protein CRG98_046162 [Punica granatum]